LFINKISGTSGKFHSTKYWDVAGILNAEIPQSGKIFRLKLWAINNSVQKNALFEERLFWAQKTIFHLFYMLAEQFHDFLMMMILDCE